MRRQLLPALTMVLVFTVITGLAYPLLVTGVAQALFHDKANGSLVEDDGEPVGSRLIGQSFTRPGYFHPRYSDTGYDPTNSAGSNLGPTNPKLLHGTKDYPGVERRTAAYRKENGLDADTAIPVDAVTGSGSSLDPHISVANARLQAPRVAHARGLPIDQVQSLVDDHTDGRGLGFLGEPGVNVLRLNLALDRL